VQRAGGHDCSLATTNLPAHHLAREALLSAASHSTFCAPCCLVMAAAAAPQVPAALPVDCGFSRTYAAHWVTGRELGASSRAVMRAHRIAHAPPAQRARACSGARPAHACRIAAQLHKRALTQRAPAQGVALLA
jgi:hypothetical protein